jgi:hypothetical protein
VKNNTLAMIATISIVLGLATMIGYLDPAVCADSNADAFVSCTEASSQHLWAFAGFTTFGVITLIVGTIRGRLIARRAESN